MATIRQKKALANLIEKNVTVGQAMRDAGYSVHSSHSPKKLTESDGFKELLKEKGLTADLIIDALVEDIRSKPQKRVGELSLGADILGLRKKADLQVGVQVNLGDDRHDYS